MHFVKSVLRVPRQGHVSFATVHGKEPGDSVQHRGITLPLWPVHCVQVPSSAQCFCSAGLHKSKLAVDRVGTRLPPGACLYIMTTVLTAQATSSLQQGS